jgi:hypothetical protein
MHYASNMDTLSYLKAISPEQLNTHVYEFTHILQYIFVLEEVLVVIKSRLPSVYPLALFTMPF